MFRRSALIILIFGLLASTAFAQTGKTSTGAKKTGTPTKPRGAATVSKNPVAVIHTTAGDLKCELFPDKAPKAVANFIGLAQGAKDWKDGSGTVQHNKPLYDGVIFHRVIPEFMIQGGDPTGSGSGDPGFTFEDELHADLIFDRPGRLAMANRGPNTNTSQFFITEKPQPSLNPCLKDEGCPELRRGKNTGYTIFGQCDPATVLLVKKIARMSRDEQDRPYGPVKIKHVDIVNPKTVKPPARQPAGSKTTAKPSSPTSKQ